MHLCVHAHVRVRVCACFSFHSKVSFFVSQAHAMTRAGNVCACVRADVCACVRE